MSYGWIQVMVACLVALGASGCGRTARETAVEQAPAAARRKVVLQTDWFPQAEHGGFYQALARGFYEQEGIAVEIWPGGPGSGIKLKVVRGDADFGMLRSDDLMLAAAQGMPLVMVAATLQHDPLALLVHENSPVRAFEQLDGRAVIGNVGMAWFPFLEKKFGIRLERRQNTYGLGEFLANPETIQQCMVTSEPFFARQHGRKTRVLPLMTAGYDCYHILFARRELIRAEPAVARAFVAASIRGWRDYLAGDPKPAEELILQRNPQMTRELLTFSREALISGRYVEGDRAKGEDVGQLSPARLEAIMGTLVELKVLERPLDLREVATREFLTEPPRGR